MAATQIIVRAKSEQIILQISSEVEIEEVHVSLLNSSSSKVTKECLVSFAPRLLHSYPFP
jgi:hypothetical protein